jgi:hypothetical protein
MSYIGQPKKGFSILEYNYQRRKRMTANRKLHFSVHTAEVLMERIDGVLDRAKRRLRVQNYATDEEIDALRLMAHEVQKLVPTEEKPDDPQSTTPEA